MSTAPNDQENMARSPISMSDEEWAKMDLSTVLDAQGTDDELPFEEPETNEPQEAPIDPEASDDVDEREEQPEDDSSEPEEPATDESTEDEGNSDDEEAADESTDETTETAEKDVPGTTDAPPPAEPETSPDYKAVYDRLFTPFKANGREIAIKSVDDAIALMQMGANYNKKMAALKPNLRLLKLLEKNQLLDEQKLSFLIDLEKKNPDAINKLVQDSGLDPMDLDAEKASAYRPHTYTVDEREVELDTVLDEIQDTPTYGRTLDVVSTKWDSKSKQVIADAPQLLKVINDHMERGIYDLIAAEVERERMFGRLNGLSDIEAYRHVGDAIQARGGFDHLVAPHAATQVPASTQPVVVPPKPKKVDEAKLRDKKRAASSTKPAVSTTPPKDFNPLALSDDEFSKLVNEHYL